MLNKRSEERRRRVMRATVEGLPDHAKYGCGVVDISASGCRINCNHLDELPDTICVQITGFGYPMMGRIVWRSKKLAGVHFSWEEQDPEKVLQDLQALSDLDVDLPDSKVHMLDTGASGPEN